MRITKKYAGASCLGRRVYHFRDRVHPTVAEIQVAKAELDHLEQRFRMRIEGGTSSTPVSSPTDIVQSLAQQVAVSNPLQTQNALQALLLGLAASQQPATSAFPSPAPSSSAPLGSSSLPFNLQALLQTAGNGAAATAPPPAVPVAPAPNMNAAVAQLLLPKSSSVNPLLQLGAQTYVYHCGHDYSPTPV